MENGVRLKGLSSWFQLPIYEGSLIQVWMIILAGLFLILLLIFLFVRFKGRSSSRKEERLPITERPPLVPTIEIANLQGIGSRDEQQDAFVISNVKNYDQDGVLMILCDGMGGMAEGKAIANETASELLSQFPWQDEKEVLTWVEQWSRQVYQKFRGQGGTTLVAVLVKDSTLKFWCVGDSDLFLLREGVIYALHLSQDYKNELLVRSLGGAFPVEEAFSNEQGKALSEYIGKEDVKCANTRLAFKLEKEDTLMLSSDGISDTLSLTQLREAMMLGSQKACDSLEEKILSLGYPSQDNYTAIILKYHGERSET